MFRIVRTKTIKANDRLHKERERMIEKLQESASLQSKLIDALNKRIELLEAAPVVVLQRGEEPSAGRELLELASCSEHIM
jgi:hypothetical protein